MLANSYMTVSKGMSLKVNTYTCVYVCVYLAEKNKKLKTKKKSVFTLFT